MELKEEFIEEKVFLNNELLDGLWMNVVLIIILSIIYLIPGKENEFINIVNIICIFISLVIGITVVYKVPNVKNDFVKYLGVGFFYLGIISFIEMYLTNSGTNEATLNAYKITINIFEFLIIIYALIFYEKKIPIIESNIIYLLSLILIFMESNFIVINNNLEITTGKYAYKFIIIIIIITIIILILILKEKKITYKEDKRWLLGIIMLFCLFKVISSLDILCYSNLIYLTKISKLMGYLLTYKYMQKKLLKNSYKYTLDKLKDIQKSKKYINETLMKKERLLEEFKMNIIKSEERYEDIIKNISDGIITFENDFLMYINDNAIEYIFYKIFGEFEEISLKYILYKLTDYKIEETDIKKGFDKEFIIKNRENNNVKISLTLKITSDIEKILLIRDLTDSNELQELKSKKEKVKVMEQIKEEFYYNVSHELRTPINIVSSALQLNNLILKNNKFDEMIKNNNIIRQNCSRLIRTVNNFIDTNRISEGFLEPNKKIYNIVNIVEAVVLACNKYMLLMNIKLVFDTYLEEIYLSCDSDHIERIILNILSNSLKHGNVGGNINVVINTKGENVIISIANDAYPIPEEKRKVIFDKFIKGDNSLTRPSEGSGLGLYITKKLVELNGGIIRIDSDKNNINVFNIIFPIKFSGEIWEVDYISDEHNLLERVNIEFSDIYFD